MKCEKCDGNGYYYAYGYFDDMLCSIAKHKCERCNGTGEMPITNDEWRKTCSEEEFAKWISNLAYACMRCGMSNGEAYCHTGHCIQDEADAAEWLKEKRT